jgi:hypothetical protein
MTNNDKDLIEALRLQGWNDAADRIEQLEAKLAKAVEALQAADLYIHDLEMHEGAEGFSISTAEAAAVYHNALAELEGKA